MASDRFRAQDGSLAENVGRACTTFPPASMALPSEHASLSPNAASSGKPSRLPGWGQPPCSFPIVRLLACLSQET